MNLRESLKHYVSYFQSQMALVYNCNNDVAAAVVISGFKSLPLLLQTLGEA